MTWGPQPGPHSPRPQTSRPWASRLAADRPQQVGSGLSNAQMLRAGRTTAPFLRICPQAPWTCLRHCPQVTESLWQAGAPGAGQDSSQEGPEKLELSPGTELGAVLGTSQEGGEHYEVRIAPVCWILPWACCCHSGLLTQSLPQPGLVVLRASPFHS